MRSEHYYNQHAAHFVEATFEVDMSNIYAVFLQHMEKNGRILDVGCGSGRDALYFTRQGFSVDAFDSAQELVALARIRTRLPIEHKSFYTLEAHNQYDGFWACASLLHCKRERLPEVFQRLIRALKVGGVGYCSFKYGVHDSSQAGRSFVNLNESQLNALLSGLANIQVLKLWVTADNRVDRQDKWLNLLIQKTAID
ncbi:class I SAM-dependent methyltransferase [Thiopseudomonas alkaliphila]|uniref:Class I SAM-dependent methyltransferase n=1 Tax=Thiopseudomonas alkaliphila TaxID=1697053 RepID=A0AAW7DQ05_9GAMM|nr:class I SAM-dependent methyltransferase [Thiopseudomonas alkaliphila]MDM1696187.1 class I SAM-dependent methyltransferase [Thiopseudomonas alkaliphila]